jgi:hypothetical protein
MPMGHLHVLFELLRATRLFIVVGGQLRGVITRDRLYDALAATLPANVSVSKVTVTLIAAMLSRACTMLKHTSTWRCVYTVKNQVMHTVLIVYMHTSTLHSLIILV